jgi:hypothetical protein
MQHRPIKRFDALQRHWLTAILGVAAILLVVSSAPLGLAQKSSGETFSSAQEAIHALFVAVKSDNEQAVSQILGGEKELVSSDDEVEDKRERDQFAQKYQEMHRLVREPDGTTFLYIGAENWPFPVPLVSRAGKWYFDADAGKQEIMFRQIGENETTAIETCRALVSTGKQNEKAPAADDPIREYAQSLVSLSETDGSNDGGGSKGDVSGPFHGYYFRPLTEQRKNGDGSAKTGLAFIAYPAEYRSSGVMTFVVDEKGVVYEKDLGPKTTKLAKEITAAHPSSSWHVVE